MNLINEQRLGVVILSAGASSRMGSPKALLRWRESTILEHLLSVWKLAGAAQIGVVFDPTNQAVIEELDRLNVADRIPNPHAAEGMMSSLRAASAWKHWESRINRVAIALVDQPQMTVQIVKGLMGFTQAHPEGICQPECNGRRSHPVILPRRDLDELGSAPEETLRDFIQSRADRRKFFPCDEPAMFEDLDTPSEYERAKAADDARSA